MAQSEAFPICHLPPATCHLPSAMQNAVFSILLSVTREAYDGTGKVVGADRDEQLAVRDRDS